MSSVVQKYPDNVCDDSEDNYNWGASQECFNERDQVRITGKLGARENTNYLDKPFPHSEAIFRLFNIVKVSFTAINRCHK